MGRRNIKHHVPLLPVLAGLVAGIVAGTFFTLPLWALFAILFALIAVAAFVTFGSPPPGANPYWRLKGAIASSSLCGCFVVVGIMVSPTGEQGLPQGVWLDGVVLDRPSEKPKTVAVEALFPSQGVTQRLLIWKDERSLALEAGTPVRVSLDGRGIFVWRDNWQIGGNARDKLTAIQRARVTCMAVRQRLIDRYRDLHADDEQLGVVMAMTLGSKAGLSSELRDIYSVTGASHVLALSGLHLGIIFFLLSNLFFVRRFLIGRALVVAALWAFAFLTGLSPSIVRSATMLSVYTLFIRHAKRGASLNVLCFTAIVMLLADSGSLFDIGFQLSFSSVASILLFLPQIERLASVERLYRYPVARWLFSLAAVSVAAQIGTAPLVAYYFGRFSTYFLLTNFLVIPCAIVILWLAIPMLLFQWQLLGDSLMWLVGIMNKGLTAIASLPLASIEGLSPSVLQVVLLYVLAAILYAILSRIHTAYRLQL